VVRGDIRGRPDPKLGLTRGTRSPRWGLEGFHYCRGQSWVYERDQVTTVGEDGASRHQTSIWTETRANQEDKVTTKGAGGVPTTARGTVDTTKSADVNITTPSASNTTPNLTTNATLLTTTGGQCSIISSIFNNKRSCR